MNEKEVNQNEESSEESWSSRDANRAKNVKTQNGPSPIVWGLLGVLSLLALGVIFVLPGIVEDYELPFTPRAQITEPESSSISTRINSPALSPFDEAQRAKQRQAAQEVLASLLERQGALEILEVSVWASEQYDAAIEMARLGDESYRTQAFEEATMQYQRADDALAQLQTFAPEVLAQALEDGQQALADGNSVVAIEQFNLALVLAPDNSTAQIGLGRAQTLEQVEALLEQARDLRETLALEPALQRVQEAIALDGAHVSARTLASDLRVQIADRTFNRIMSEGFSALQSDNPDSAIAAFERALAMRPGSAQAQEAISQTQDQIAVAQITANRAAAEAFQQQERWADAVQEYEAALAIDGNIIFAVQGKDYASKRLQLDQLLQNALDQPERLADTAVYEQAAQVYYTGRNIEPAGERLEAQLQALEILLSKAQVPVEIQLVSDNSTQVTVYQVGELGMFNSRVLNLKPGKYVAVGTRAGYRDVRQEFEVGFDNNGAPVTVACTEEIVAVNRR
ncbi:MAG: tetratricopeptide repeat protein [Gammaproteobacteria bacterium]